MSFTHVKSLTKRYNLNLIEYNSNLIEYNPNII